MVMLDYSFDSEVFDLDEVYFAESLKGDNYQIRFAADRVDGQLMAIYIDVFGNERRETKTLRDFAETRKK